MKEVDYDDLSPMWADWKISPHRHFYIKELAKLTNGNFVIPMRWVVYEKKEHAEAYRVTWDADVSRITLFKIGSDTAATSSADYFLFMTRP